MADQDDPGRAQHPDGPLTGPTNFEEHEAAPDNGQTIEVSTKQAELEKVQAEAKLAQGQVEENHDQRKFGGPIAIAATVAYSALTVAGILAAFFDTEAFNNLLKLYALIMPVLGVVLGGVAARYLGSNGGK